MKLNKTTAIVLLVFVLTIAALAAWGDYLHMSQGALTWIRAVAAMIGAAVLAALPAIFADKDGDGIPDVLEQKTPPTNPPRAP